MKMKNLDLFQCGHLNFHLIDGVVAFMIEPTVPTPFLVGKKTLQIMVTTGNQQFPLFFTVPDVSKEGNQIIFKADVVFRAFDIEHHGKYCMKITHTFNQLKQDREICCSTVEFAHTLNIPDTELDEAGLVSVMGLNPKKLQIIRMFTQIPEIKDPHTTEKLNNIKMSPSAYSFTERPTADVIFDSAGKRGTADYFELNQSGGTKNPLKKNMSLLIDPVKGNCILETHGHVSKLKKGTLIQLTEGFSLDTKEVFIY